MFSSFDDQKTYSCHQLDCLKYYGFPDSLIECIEPFISKRAGASEYYISNNSSKYKFPCAIVLNKTSELRKLFSALATNANVIKFEDIVSYEYSIYAYNDSSSSIISATKQFKKYIQTCSKLYAIKISIKIDNKWYKLGIHISSFYTNCDNDSANRICKYATSELISDVKNIFKNNIVIKDIAIEDFVEYCRNQRD